MSAVLILQYMFRFERRYKIKEDRSFLILGFVMACPVVVIDDSRTMLTENIHERRYEFITYPIRIWFLLSALTERT